MIKKLVLFLAVAFLLSFPSYCYEGDVSEYIPKEMQDKLPEDILENSKEAGSIINYEKIIDALLGFFKNSLKSVLKNFFTILSLVIISACFNMLCNSLQSEGIKRCFSYITSICFAVVLYKILDSLWTDMSVLFQDVNSFMNAVTPSITMIYVLCGNISSAAVNEAGTSIMLTVFQDICYYGIRPILQVCFGFSVVSCMSGSLNLAPISRFVRSTYTTILIFVISIMSFVMSLQTMLGQSGDSLGIHTVKFASSVAIPIVGGALSEATTSIARGVGMVKTSFGILAVIALAMMVLPTLINLWMNKLAFNLGCAVCSVFGIEKESELVSSAGELINFALAITCAVSVMFILNIALFSRASVALGG
ncbi:MAG: hypothetical protein IKU52_00290 [Clostridia bacterium]|nr:hypothetical protein [Clostridia bacterium]